MQMDIYTLFFDGSCGPMNPGGNIGLGCVISKSDEIIFEDSAFIPKERFKNGTSSNVAEYMALIRGLTFLHKESLFDEDISIYGDSQLVIKQMNNEWRIKEGVYVPFAEKCMDLLSPFKNIKLFWIPREQNEYADMLSTKQMKLNGSEFVKKEWMK